MTKDPALTYLDDCLDNLKEMLTTDNLLILDSPIDMMLDHHGSLFGIKRLPKEINQDYRSRIVIELIERQEIFIKGKKIVDQLIKGSDESYSMVQKFFNKLENSPPNKLWSEDSLIDMYGELWGINRLDKETNDDYRKRIINRIMRKPPTTFVPYRD